MAQETPALVPASPSPPPDQLCDPPNKSLHSLALRTLVFEIRRVNSILNPVSFPVRQKKQEDT